MNNDPQIIKPLLVLPKKMIGRGILSELRAAGYIVIETSKPRDIQFITPPPTLALNSLASVALSVMLDEKVYNHKDEFKKRIMDIARAELEASKKAASPAAG